MAKENEEEHDPAQQVIPPRVDGNQVGAWQVRRMCSKCTGSAVQVQMESVAGVVRNISVHGMARMVQ